MKSRYFLCTRGGGCRLTDLDLFLVENQAIERSNELIEKSRSIRAAINAEWIKEIDKVQYDKINLNLRRELRKKAEGGEIDISKR